MVNYERWGIHHSLVYIGTSGGTRFALVVWLCGVTTRTSLADEDGSLFWLWCLGYVDRMNWMANKNIGMAARTQWNCGKTDTGISLDSCTADGGNWNLSLDCEDGMDGRVCDGIADAGGRIYHSSIYGCFDGDGRELWRRWITLATLEGNQDTG